MFLLTITFENFKFIIDCICYIAVIVNLLCAAVILIYSCVRVIREFFNNRHN